MKWATGLGLGLVATGAMSGSAQAGHGFAMGTPPARLSMTGRSTVAEGQPAFALEFAAGLNWATLNPRETSWDVGLGYLSVDVGRAGGSSWDPDAPSMRGMYVESGVRLHQGRQWRTWVTVRGEVMRGKVAPRGNGDGSIRPSRGFAAFGAAARVEAEVYLGGFSASAHHLWLGNLGVSAYVEAGVRATPDAVGGSGVGAGMAIRLPLAGFWT